MKEGPKRFLQKIGWYHPLQSAYRSALTGISKYRYRLLYHKFKGHGYTCNVCTHSYTKFVDHLPGPINRPTIERYQVVAGYGSNIYCPYCLSTARDRLVVAMLTRLAPRNKTILHLSPEQPILHFLKRDNKVITADLYPKFYKRVDGQVQKEDLTDLSFVDGAFDLVVANHILEHIPDDRQAMREIFRVLKPGGRAILQVPYTSSFPTMEEPFINDPLRQSTLFGQKDHVRIYALQDYIQRLGDTGFEVKEFSHEELETFYVHAIQEKESFLEISRPNV